MLVLFLTWAAAFSAPALAQPAAAGESSTVEFSSASKTADTGPEMADVMRRDGKIYIVVAVLVSVLVGILLYLISLDKKISRLERELRQ